jgi:voltage-gated potassium channel
VEQRRVAIFGYRKLGSEVAAHLAHTPCDLVVVDNEKASLARAGEKGFATMEIDFADDGELVRLGIGRDIDVVFCLLPEDAQNVFLVLSARALSPSLKIVSVSDSRDSAVLLKAAGANKIIDPYEIVGARITELIRQPVIVEILEKTVFGQADLDLAEVEIRAGSVFDQRQLANINVRADFNLIVIGSLARDRGDRFNFQTHYSGHVLHPGDVVVVIGRIADIDRFREAAEAAPYVTRPEPDGS